MFTGYLTGLVRLTTCRPFAPKGKSKFEILLVKIFSLKQKRKSNTSRYNRKNQRSTFQQDSVWFR